MKALLYKDIIILKNNSVVISILSFFLIIAIISGNVDIAYLIATFGLVIFFIIIFESDYKNNFYKYIISNAVDEKSIVIYRYFLIFSTVISVFLFNFLIAFVTGYDKTFYRFLLFSSINILLYEILIPIFFRFGKIAIAVTNVIGTVIYIVGVFYLIKNNTILKFEIGNKLNIFIILIIIDLILFVFSFLLSLKFIKRRIS
ncbi:ABC-2 transporter permease [Parvimonas sp. C2]|uniref:ABC-2 transporter permease n=1 Tax=Parvimonas sp. C2 TaxID=3110692 RepID=UPI002B498B97|nr:ABC-2 transporter permease [Parvimonas sp. C2]MEB3072604.1 ABC-2 transporter permease [Parvimonas sp. C2]